MGSRVNRKHGTDGDLSRNYRTSCKPSMFLGSSSITGAANNHAQGTSVSCHSHHWKRSDITCEDRVITFTLHLKRRTNDILVLCYSTTIKESTQRLDSHTRQVLEPCRTKGQVPTSGSPRAENWLPVLATCRLPPSSALQKQIVI